MYCISIQRLNLKVCNCKSKETNFSVIKPHSRDPDPTKSKDPNPSEPGSESPIPDKLVTDFIRYSGCVNISPNLKSQIFAYYKISAPTSVFSCCVILCFIVTVIVIALCLKKEGPHKKSSIYKLAF